MGIDARIQHACFARCHVELGKKSGAVKRKFRLVSLLSEVQAMKNCIAGRRSER